MNGIFRAAAAALVITGSLAGAPALADDEGKLNTGLKAASPQPAKGSLQPGLHARYHWTYVRHLRTLERFAQGRKGEEQGVLPKLQYHTGQGKVLTSERTNGVGAHITGFIKFDKPGEYVFLVHSNDGVRLTIGGKKLFEDPLVHADEMSDPIRVKIDAPGWYPIEVWYYERKGTSTLELYWKGPGDAGKPVIVPASAFAHMPK